MKKILRKFLTLVFAVCLFSVLIISVHAAWIDTHEPNDTPATASVIGYWKYYFPVWGTIGFSGDDDYFQFSAYSGDRIAITLEGIPAGSNYSLILCTSSGTPIATSDRAGNANEIIRYNVPTSGSYLVRVRASDLSWTEDFQYKVSMIDRIQSGSYTASLSPSSISSPGAGVDSPIASANLASIATLPNSGIVKSVKASGTISPSLGSTFRFCKTSTETTWHKTISGSTQFTDITLSNNIPLKSTWQVKYHSLAYSSSTWSGVKLDFTYEYDTTENYL